MVRNLILPELKFYLLCMLNLMFQARRYDTRTTIFSPEGTYKMLVFKIVANL